MSLFIIILLIDVMAKLINNPHGLFFQVIFQACHYFLYLFAHLNEL
jgi:uncharacterized membrane protein YczE